MHRDANGSLLRRLRRKMALKCSDCGISVQNLKTHVCNPSKSLPKSERISGSGNQLETKGDASLASRGPEAQNIGAQISKRGRPRIGEQRGKPWLSSVPPMSERTYRRRLSEQRRKKEQEK